MPGSLIIDADSWRAADCRYEPEKDVNVQTRALDTTNPLPSLLSPKMEMSSYAAPLMAAHVVDSPATDAEAEWPLEAVVDWSKLGKGIRWALGLEGLATLAVYGMWQLWHLWR